MTNCLFCRICAGEVPAEVLHRDELTVAFKDVNPQAPVHALVVPREHIASLADVTIGQLNVVTHLLLTVRTLAAELGLGGGWRAVTNVGSDGGQTVDHLHIHLLGGRQLAWPPG